MTIARQQLQVAVENMDKSIEAMRLAKTRLPKWFSQQVDLTDLAKEVNLVATKVWHELGRLDDYYGD